MAKTEKWTPGSDGDMIDDLARLMDGKAEEPTAPEIVERHGARAELHPVSAGMIEDAYERYPDPEDKEAEDYAERQARAAYERGKIILEAMLLFGVKLVHMPEDARWLENLQFMERRGRLDLSSYDLENQTEREFVFKRYVLLTPLDLLKVGRKTGLDQETMDLVKKAI